MQSAATPPRTMTSVFPLKYVLLAFASYFVAMDAIFAAVWFAVAVLIFWRRSDDRMTVRLPGPSHVRDGNLHWTIACIWSWSKARSVDVLTLPSAVSSSIMAVMDSSSGASITDTMS